MTAMLDLAMQGGVRPVTLAAISGRQRISLSYLEQLFGKLRRHTLVESVRGPGGGYTIARDFGTISVADIIAAVDESVDATQCGGKENCQEEGKCITHDLWSNLNQHIFDYLGAVTLKQLVDEQKSRQIGVPPVTAQLSDMRSMSLMHRRPAVSP